MKNKIMAVVVVYEKKLAEVSSLTVLNEAIKQGMLSHLLLYDNSLKTQETDAIVENQINYIHDSTNSGLSKAYNTAYKEVLSNGDNLLLLLDQDTQIDLNYLKELVNLKVGTDVGAILPLIKANDLQISPVYTDEYINKNSKNVSPGIVQKSLMAINSGTVLPIATIEEIGGFNQEFPLDYLDHWLFWKLGKLNKKFIVLDHTFAHELSVLDYSQVSAKRYESIITAETLYYTKYNTENLSTHRKHLKKRLLKQYLTVKNRNIYKRTISEIKKLARSN